MHFIEDPCFSYFTHIDAALFGLGLISCFSNYVKVQGGIEWGWTPGGVQAPRLSSGAGTRFPGLINAIIWYSADIFNNRMDQNIYWLGGFACGTILWI
jgi:hypothetical protein